MSSNTQFKLRAHHGMCLHYFQGKGYSSSFTENMSSVLTYLNENDPLVTVIADCDNICSKCPNLIFGKCITSRKVSKYDNNTLKSLDIESGTTMKYSEYSKLIEDKIINSGIRGKICSDCRWNDLCK